MAIDRLSSTAALIASLRDDAIRRMGPARGAIRDAGGKTPVENAAMPSRPPVARLRRELMEIVNSVSPTDAGAGRELPSRMARAVLLWEFGAELREHPEWRPMLDGIVDTLMADPKQTKTFELLVRKLKKLK
ncbi:MAG TPA: hypothetical protein VGC19_10985 [Rhodanobacter sp.]